MLIRVLVVIAFLHLGLPLGEAVKCYHCFDSFTKTMVSGTLQDHDNSSKFVRCDKNKNNWNTWDCSEKWPVCVFASTLVKDHYEVIRTCGVKDFCSKYVPPANVEDLTCLECDTTLCNDYSKKPDPPVGPGPLFTFNININLNLKKNPFDNDSGIH